MVEIRGKRGHKVPVLSTKEVKKAMVLLVEKREAVGINQESPTFLQGQMEARL